MIGALAKHVRTWVGNTSRQVPPPKRSALDPVVTGVDPTPFSFARSRGASSLYLPDEDVLAMKGAGDAHLVGWMGRTKQRVQPIKQLYDPAPRDHPAFRARGRKVARAVAHC